MKLKYALISMCALLYMIFAGCSNTSEGATKTANEFLNQFYTMTAEKSDEIINSMSDNIKAEVNSAYDVFKPLMTEEAFDSLKANRMYFRNILFCANNDCSLKVKQLDWEQTFYDKKEGKIGFNYTVSIEIAYNNGKNQEETEKGYVGLQEKNNAWLIYSTKITGTSKKLTSIYN